MTVFWRLSSKRKPYNIKIMVVDEHVPISISVMHGCTWNGSDEFCEERAYSGSIGFLSIDLYSNFEHTELTEILCYPGYIDFYPGCWTHAIS